MSGQGETEKPGATVNSADRLEWQSELDSAMSELDTRLQHPRRRASDVGPQPTLPELGQFDVTKELLDEISWRVAEQLRRTQHFAQPAAVPATVPTPTAADAVGYQPPPPVAPVKPAMPQGAAIVIRLRSPLFTWPFKRRSRRRQSSMISLSDYRAT